MEPLFLFLGSFRVLSRPRPFLAAIPHHPDSRADFVGPIQRIVFVKVIIRVCVCVYKFREAALVTWPLARHIGLLCIVSFIVGEVFPAACPHRVLPLLHLG